MEAGSQASCRHARGRPSCPCESTACLSFSQPGRAARAVPTAASFLRPPRRAGTAGQLLHCGWWPATWRPSCQSCHSWHSWPAWSPRAAPVWLPTHFTGGKRLNSAGPGSGSGGLAPSCHPPPEPPTLTGLAPSCHLPPELPASSASPRPCGSRHILLAENA